MLQIHDEVVLKGSRGAHPAIMEQPLAHAEGGPAAPTDAASIAAVSPLGLGTIGTTGKGVKESESSEEPGWHG